MARGLGSLPVEGGWESHPVEEIEAYLVVEAGEAVGYQVELKGGRARPWAVLDGIPGGLERAIECKNDDDWICCGLRRGCGFGCRTYRGHDSGCDCGCGYGCGFESATAGVA